MHDQSTQGCRLSPYLTSPVLAGAMPEDRKRTHLTVGDTVSWCGAWGADNPMQTVVTGIEITKGGKYGDKVGHVHWSQVFGRNVVVSLDNGHWAYGGQLRRNEEKGGGSC